MIAGDELIRDSGLIAENFLPENLQPASYDLRADDEYLIEPGRTGLLGTMEYVSLDRNFAGFIKDRSSFLRKAVTVGQGYVDPGFRGNLTVMVRNDSGRTLRIRKGTAFCQIVFMRVEGSESSYQGHYQNSRGVRKACND